MSSYSWYPRILECFPKIWFEITSVAYKSISKYQTAGIIHSDISVLRLGNSSWCFHAGRESYSVDKCYVNNKINFMYILFTHCIKSLKTSVLLLHNFLFRKNVPAWWKAWISPYSKLTSGFLSLIWKHGLVIRKLLVLIPLKETRYF